MIALAGDDPEADAHAFRELEMGDYEPFHFERRGKRADGTPTHVAFTLAFAHARTMPGIGFFTCRHEKPENFWDKGLQDHANGATGVSKVTIVAENPADHAEFLSHFTQVRAFHSSSMGVEFLLGEGQKIEVLTPLAFEFHHGPQRLERRTMRPTSPPSSCARPRSRRATEALTPRPRCARGAQRPHSRCALRRVRRDDRVRALITPPRCRLRAGAVRRRDRAWAGRSSAGRARCCGWR